MKNLLAKHTILFLYDFRRIPFSVGLFFLYTTKHEDPPRRSLEWKKSADELKSLFSLSFQCQAQKTSSPSPFHPSLLLLIFYYAYSTIVMGQRNRFEGKEISLRLFFLPSPNIRLWSALYAIHRDLEDKKHREIFLSPFSGEKNTDICWICCNAQWECGCVVKMRTIKWQTNSFGALKCCVYASHHPRVWFFTYFSCPCWLALHRTWLGTVHHLRHSVKYWNKWEFSHRAQLFFFSFSFFANSR